MNTLQALAAIREIRLQLIVLERQIKKEKDRRAGKIKTIDLTLREFAAKLGKKQEDRDDMRKNHIFRNGLNGPIPDFWKAHNPELKKLNFIGDIPIDILTNKINPVDMSKVKNIAKGSVNALSRILARRNISWGPIP